ncbi:1,4-dihydroxy-2-naphthoyl-CoA synthase, partial [Staphylococcus pseudintermedius]
HVAPNNAKVGQSGPKGGACDAGYGSGYFERIVGFL